MVADDPLIARSDFTPSMKNAVEKLPIAMEQKARRAQSHAVN